MEYEPPTCMSHYFMMTGRRHQYLSHVYNYERKNMWVILFIINNIHVVIVPYHIFFMNRKLIKLGFSPFPTSIIYGEKFLNWTLLH